MMDGAIEVGPCGVARGVLRGGARRAAAMSAPAAMSTMLAILAALAMLAMPRAAGAAVAAPASAVGGGAGASPVAGALPASGAAGAPPAGSRAALAAAQELFELRRYAEAEAAFADVSQALAVGDADRVEALSAMSEARLLEGRYQDAFAAASQAIGESAAGSRETGRARSVICRSLGRLAAGERPAPPVEGMWAADSGGVGGTDGEAGDSADDAGVLEVSPRLRARVHKPIKMYAPPPAYTEEARKARLQGVVTLEAVIDRYGCVANARVVKPLPMGLDRSALDAVSTWAFKPALLDGRPVKVYYTVTITFQVEKEPAAPALPAQ